MKTFLFIPVLFLLVITSCNKKETGPNCDDETFKYTFSNNKQIDTVHYSPTFFQAVVNAGTNRVFRYEYSSSICGNIADDGYFDDLIFEVPAGVNSFTYNDPIELENGKCYFIRSCFCGNVMWRLVNGSISGTRISDNKWSIQVSVIEPLNNISVSFNKNFILE